MGDLREIAENHLAITLEGRFGLPVELTDPDGAIQIYSAHDEEALLMAQVLFDTTYEDPETGGVTILEDPVITLRRTSLNRIPVDGEYWLIRIPTEPREDASKESYVLSDLPIQGGASLGIIRLYLTKPKQSS